MSILEGRADLGGTWDLFRYPGIRSDSDMYTLGYRFKPWTDAKAIADGPSILKYVRDTAHEHGIDRHIRYGHMVKRADWSTADAAWTVTAEQDGANADLHLQFPLHVLGLLQLRQGLYARVRRARPISAGTIVHPQLWPEDLDYSGKRVVVIGSGATAVTLVPEMAKTAAQVTMLQRSPTYVVSRPSEDGVANWLRAKLPAEARLRHHPVEERPARHVLLPHGARSGRSGSRSACSTWSASNSAPTMTSRPISRRSYNPWDQRVCLVPDADLFDFDQGAASRRS